MSRTPDIQLGPGDTLPATALTLYQPDNADGSQGPPMQLLEADGVTSKAVAIKYQPWTGASGVVTRSATVMQTSLTAGVGDLLIDWLANGGAIASGNYRLRVVVTGADSRQETWPNGPDVDLPDGTNPSYLWLQVARDFA